MSIAPLNASLLPRVQPPQEQKTYTVQHGDTIGGIASKQGVSTQDLIAKIRKSAIPMRSIRAMC